VRGRVGRIEKRGRGSGKPASKAKQAAHAPSQADPALVVGVALPAVSCSGRCQKVFDLRGQGSEREEWVQEEHEKRKVGRGARNTRVREAERVVHTIWERNCIHLEAGRGYLQEGRTQMAGPIPFSLSPFSFSFSFLLPAAVVLFISLVRHCPGSTCLALPP